MKKIFLGGTCNNDSWREELVIPVLQELGFDFFNPVVEDWTEDCIVIEEKEKKEAFCNLFVITSNMKGVYSIAEAVYLACKSNQTTAFIVVDDGFDEGELKSLKAVMSLIEEDALVNITNRDSLPEVIKKLVEILNEEN